MKKSIKSLIRVAMVSGIVVMFNIFNVRSSFALVDDPNIKMSDFISQYKIENNNVQDKCTNFYKLGNFALDTGDRLIKYSNNSWCLFNSSTKKYIFKPIESNKELNFDNEDDYNKCIYMYKNIKNVEINGEYGTHSKDMYIDNLTTDENLEEYAEQWLKDNYNIDLDIPIYYTDISLRKNGDKNIGGLYIYNERKGKSIPYEIIINEGYNNKNIQAEKLLIHELTHYALDKLDKPFDDDDNYFKDEVIKNGGNTNDERIGTLHSHLKCTL